MGIIVDDSVESNLLLIRDLGNRVDGAHHELVEMSIHQKLGLATKH